MADEEGGWDYSDSIAQRANAFSTLCCSVEDIKDPEIRALALRMLERLVTSIPVPEKGAALTTFLGRRVDES